MQTYIHNIVLLFQSDSLPRAWRQFDITTFNAVAQSLKVEVPGQESTIYSSAQAGPAQREFFDWRKLMTMFILIGAPMAENSQLTDYRNKLSDAASADDDSIKLE